MDSFTATCAEIENSALAVYVALFDEKGKLKYLALSGRPKNESGLTKITAMDLRRVFLQKCWIQYSSYQSSPTVKNWVSYLLNRPIAISGGYLGISYSVDLIDFDTNAVSWISGSIASADSAGDLWEELQAAMMRYGFVLSVEGNITTDSGTNKTTGSITVKAKVLSGTYSIKLSDFDTARVMDDSTDPNRAIARSTDGMSQIEYWIFYYKDGSEKVIEKNAGLSLMSGNSNIFLHYPACYEIYVEDDFNKACSEAQNEMEKNRYKGSVELQLDTSLANQLRSANLWSQGLIYGYNSADDSSAKLLPMMSITEDDKGSMSCVFGRLDDYFNI
jgi:hypothetical protein